MTGVGGTVEVVRFADVGDGFVNEYDKLVRVGENKGVVVIGPDEDKTAVEVEFFAELGYVVTGTGALVVDARYPVPVTFGTLDGMTVGPGGVVGLMP